MIVKMLIVLISKILFLSTIAVTSNPDCYSSSPSYSLFDKELLCAIVANRATETETSTKELQYIFSKFSISRDILDVADSRDIAFLTGSAGKTINSKNDFFSAEYSRLISGGIPIYSELFIFNSQESEKVHYKAAIVYYTKIKLTKKYIVKQLIKQLK